MVELTIGVASACIAAGIALLQFIIPNALALILTGTLSHSHSAVTWSVVSRFLLSSDWPLLLRSETSSSTAVAKDIAVVTWLKPLTLLVAAVAAIVTPLGLHDGIWPATSTQEVTFVYAVDRGPLGAGTPARNIELGFSRSCPDVACPGEPDLGNVTYTVTSGGINTTASYRIYSPEIPQSLVDLYESGVEHDTSLSSFFDVQYRQWTTSSQFFVVDNSSYLTGDWKMLASSLLNDRYEILDGIILDTINGSIGFRNHSVPVNMVYGAEWDENILFLEPEAVCLNTNLTTYYRLTQTGAVDIDDQGLVDHGGFVNLNRTHPYPESADNVTGDYPFLDGQSDPKLFGRTYFAAWLTNVLSMQFLNVSEPNTNRSRISSVMGQKFRVNSTFVGYEPTDIQSIVRVQSLGDLVKVDYNTSNRTYSSNPEIANPWNISQDMFDDMSQYCKTSYPGDPVNITELAVEIGLVGGVGYRVDEGSEGSTDTKAPNSTWERPIYVCSGVTKAKIKTVTFRYNSTIDNSLAGLYIVAVNEKLYDDGVPSPTWGFETPIPQYNVSHINPLWGIIDPAQADSATLTTWQAPSFYIPHSSESTVNHVSDLSYSAGDNVALIRAPPDLWASTLDTSISDTYSGKNDMRLQLLWNELSRNSSGIEKMLRLIWVDKASNYLVGTKGHHTAKYRQPVPYSANAKRQVKSATEFPVHVLEHRIRYHWMYAIPALICICIVGVALFVALISIMCGRGTIPRLRYYLCAVTSGRVMASFVYADAGGVEHRQADTKTWIEEVGHKPIQIFEQLIPQAQTTGAAYGDDSHRRKKSDYMSVRQKEDS